MKKRVKKLIKLIIPRRFLWRFGRSLYLIARADLNNEMNTNGEKKVQESILKNLSKTDEKIVFFDIGANIGVWTLAALDQADKLGVGKRFEIYSFEPVPSTYNTLSKHIIEQKQTIGSVHLINQALSSSNGQAEMFIFGENAGTNSLHHDDMSSRNDRIIISMTTGDNYCSSARIDKIHFMKCDTEGHDMDVLLGIKGLIESERILVFQFEYNHRWIYSRHYLKDVFDFIGVHHYKIGKITPVAVELYENWHPELEKFFEGNYLIIHENYLDWFNLTKGNFDIFGTYGI